METIQFQLEGGGQLLVRVDDQSPQEGAPVGIVTRGGLAARLEQAHTTFEAALDPIRAVAHGVLEKLAALGRPPDDVHVEFALELTANAGAILTAVGSTAQLKVGLTWRRAAEGEGTVGN